MKEIDRKDTPAVSGGETLPILDGPCFPPFPSQDDYPRNPTFPYTEDPLCPEETA